MPNNKENPKKQAQKKEEGTNQIFFVESTHTEVINLFKDFCSEQKVGKYAEKGFIADLLPIFQKNAANINVIK